MAIASLNRRPIGPCQAPGAAPRRAPAPLPPRWVERERRVEMPPLSHFVVLSLLLHILAIVLVGVPSGGSEEGRAMWGSLRVTLAPARPAVPPAPAAPQAGEAFPRLLDRIPVAEPKHDALPRLVVPPPIEAQAEQATAPAVALPLPLPTQPTAPAAGRTLVESPRVIAAPVPPAPVIDLPRVQLAPAVPQAERALLEAPRVLVAPAPVQAAEAPVLPRPAEAMPRPIDNALTQDIAPPPGITPAERVAPRLDPAARIERDAPAPAPVKTPAEAAPSPFRAPAAAAPRANDAANYDPTAPSLDPEALRKRAAALSREGSGQRAILPFPMPPVPEKKGKIEDILDKARKPDCRTAYQQLGLAAIIPLLANEIGEGHCRW